MTMVNPSSRQRRTIPWTSEDDTPAQSSSCHHFAKERSIVFINDRNIQIREINYNMDRDLYEKLWYSKTDYNSFSAHDELIVKIARAGNFHETAEHSIRGLEKQLGDSTINDVEHMAIEAVQQEQQRQYRHRIRNPDVIANIYRLASISSKHEARIRGIQDALHVNQSPMLGFSIDGEHYACDEQQPNTRRKPRSRSMFHVAASTTDVDHSSSHRSVRNSFHSHPITRTDRKSKYSSSSLHERLVNTEVSQKREPIPTPRRKPRSVSMLGSMTSNATANEVSPGRPTISPQNVVARRKPRSVSMLGSITSHTNANKASSELLVRSSEKVSEKQEAISTPRRKARSVSMLGSITSANSYVNEPSSDRLIMSPHKHTSKTSSAKALTTNHDGFLSSKFAFTKDAVTEECIRSSSHRDTTRTRSFNKREGKQDGDTLTKSRLRSPRRRRSSIEHNRTKVNIVQ